MKKIIQTLFEGRILTLNKETHELPNGQIAEFEVARHLAAASIVPFSEDESKILMIRQYRPVIDAWVWEIPAGLIDPGEAPIDCARRELEEETGWKVKKIEPLTSIHTSFGFTDEVIHIFKGVGLDPSQKRTEPTEIIEEHFFDRAEILQMIRRNEISDSKTLAGLTLALCF